MLAATKWIGWWSCTKERQEEFKTFDFCELVGLSKKRGGLGLEGQGQGRVEFWGKKIGGRVECGEEGR